MQAEIIAIGSELLLGTTVDTNSAYLARQLARAGVDLVRKSSVGDDTERIATMVSEALNRADLVICTGGLGPTLDDVTREGVALATARPLAFHQTLLDQIEARFTAMGRTMSPSNRRQAYVPTGARIVENPRGTAPAFIVEDDRGTVIVLPGVPYEMRYLFENAVMPYLRDERGITDAILVKTVHATGLGESVIGEMIADLMEQANPSVGISAKQARYEIRITAHGASQAEAEAMLATTEATIRERLKQHVIGDEPLPATVARLLKEQDLTLALYETSTLAPIFRALSAVSGGTECISGVLIHPLDRAANEEAAAILSQTGAFSIVDRWRADLGLAFQVADTSDQSGLTAVSVTLVTPKGNRQVTRNYDLRQTEGWEFVATLGLDLIRRYLVGEAA